MGTPMTSPAALVDRGVWPVTPLMAFLAREHADGLARVWPAPHEDFLMLPAARRHGAAILVARGGYSAQRLQWLAARARDSEFAAELYGPHPPGGVMKALGRMGETLWTAAAYQDFLDLFLEDAARLLIRHMQALRPEVMAVLAVLPPRLRLAAVVAHLGTDRPAAADIASAWAMALRVRGEAAAGDIAQRFSRAKSWQALFETAGQVIQPLALGAVLPPPELPQPFQPVRRLEMLSNIALEFRNCLRDFLPDIAAGHMAVWVWRGEGGPAAVALRRDPAGWRLAEARGHGNDDLTDEVLMDIVAAVRAAGGRTGESWMVLNRRLADRIHDAPQEPQQQPAASWRAQLALGYLWD